MNSTQGGHMSNKQNEEWLEAVKECLLEMTVDIHVFNQALNGQTGADVIATSTSLSGGYTMTLGDQNMSSATGNVVLIRIALTSGQSVTALSIGEAA